MRWVKICVARERIAGVGSASEEEDGMVRYRQENPG